VAQHPLANRSTFSTKRNDAPVADRFREAALPDVERALSLRLIGERIAPG